MTLSPVSREVCDREALVTGGAGLVAAPYIADMLSTKSSAVSPCDLLRRVCDDNAEELIVVKTEDDLLNGIRLT